MKSRSRTKTKNDRIRGITVGEDATQGCSEVSSQQHKEVSETRTRSILPALKPDDSSCFLRLIEDSTSVRHTAGREASCVRPCST